MEKKLTPEQALANVTIAVERDFVGKKQEHIMLHESLNVLKSIIESLNKDEENGNS